MTSQKGASTIAPVAVSPRIVLSLPAELLDKLTEMAKNNGLSRASYMRMVLTKHIQEQEASDGDN